ncbi:MAG: ferritin-like domain-containing protein [Pseudomonadota bacterium]
MAEVVLQKKNTDRRQKLLEKGRAAQSQSHLNFDWDRPVKIPFWLPNSIAASAVSQFHYGEGATARMCRQLRPSIPEMAAQEFLETQALDEDRHARIFSTYLDKLGGVRPISEPMQVLYEEALAWKGAPEAIMVAFHVILEGEALRLCHGIDAWMPCPLFRELSAVVARDEARHVAWGKLYLRDSLPHLPRHERLEIYLWSRALWFRAATTMAGKYTPLGILGSNERFGVWMERKWQERLGDLKSAGLFTEEERPAFIRASQ